MRRIVSLIVALVAWAGGHALLFWSGVGLQRALESSGSAAVVSAAPLAVLGAALVGVAALTAAWSSLGAILIGVIQSVAGLVVAVVPPGSAGSRTVVGDAVTWLAGLGDIGNGMSLWLVGGACAVEGVVLFVLGVAASRRRAGFVVEHPAVARLVALIVTLVGLLPGALLALHGGALQQTAMYAMLRGPSVLGLVLLGLGLVVLVLLATGVRWSGLGAIVAGALLFLATAAANVVPALLPATTRLSAGYWDWRDTVTTLPRDVQVSLTENVALGTLTVIGALFLFGGIASVVAGRHARSLHRSNYIEPGTEELETQQSPFGIFEPR
jgi:hypothetical protein